MENQNVKIKIGDGEERKSSNKISDEKNVINGLNSGLVENEKTSKPRISFVSLTSCGGCQLALWDLGKGYLKLMEQVEVVELSDDNEESELAVVFVEGSPITKEDEKMLHQARRSGRLLVALGNCAAMGGVLEIRNYQKSDSSIKQIYRYMQGISDRPVREIDNLVKVDFTLPGCPIDIREFVDHLPSLLAGKIPEVYDNSVCDECELKGGECLIPKGRPCFGPMILGGCGAVCLKAGKECQGCRGLRPGDDSGDLLAVLEKNIPKKEVESSMEIFGLKDDIKERGN